MLKSFNLSSFLPFSYNNNRPPQYHQSPTASQPPSLPHHSSQQPHWQHSTHSYPSSISNPISPHQDYYQSSTNTTSFTPHLSGMTQTMERNNNEPSMVAPNRYTQINEQRTSEPTSLGIK